MKEVTLRLARGDEALDELLAGEYASRFWLKPIDGEQGVYKIACMASGQDTTEALMRYLAGETIEPRAGVPPPTPMSPRVADLLERWAALMLALPKEDEDQQ